MFASFLFLFFQDIPLERGVQKKICKMERVEVAEEISCMFVFCKIYFTYSKTLIAKTKKEMAYESG